jgi:Zinc finger, C2H2 type
MANTSPTSECSSHLSAPSPQFSDSGYTASTFSSPAQPYLSPATISTSLERGGYSLTRAGSSGKIRKPSPDLNSYVDQNGKRRYKCKDADCTYTSPRPNNLREHQGRHDPDRPKPWQCRMCDRAFPRKNDCKRHFTKVHIKMNEEDNPALYAYLQEKLRQSIEPLFPLRSRPQG